MRRWILNFLIDGEFHNSERYFAAKLFNLIKIVINKATWGERSSGSERRSNFSIGLKADKARETVSTCPGAHGHLTIVPDTREYGGSFMFPKAMSCCFEVLCHVEVFALLIWRRFGLDHWIYWHLLHTSRNYRQYSAIADLHTSQFTVTQERGFSVFTSRILATDLSQSHCHFTSHMKTSSHRLILLLSLFSNGQLGSIPLLSSSYPARPASRTSTHFTERPPLNSFL
jgi:hypothetical protein